MSYSSLGLALWVCKGLFAWIAFIQFMRMSKCLFPDVDTFLKHLLISYYALCLALWVYSFYSVGGSKKLFTVVGGI